MTRRTSSLANMKVSSNLMVLVTLAAALGIMNSRAVVADQTKVLRFFFHDRLNTATKPSAFMIAPPLGGFANLINTGAPIMGMAAVFDDSMTVGPEETSMEIGRARGFYLFDENGPTLEAGSGLEFSFTAELNKASGYTPGSTLTFKGFDRVLSPVREIAIVGGTGDLRLARGWAVITTYSLSGYGNAVLNITAYFKYGF